MTDMLIRDVPDDVIAALEAHARRLGLSRTEYVRRRLAQDAGRRRLPRQHRGPDPLRRHLRRPGRPRRDVAGLAVTTWLIDKSALVRLGASPDADKWASRIERGLVRITTVTRLEVGYFARSAHDLRAGLRQPPVSAMPAECLTPAIEDRAVEVLTLLADQGQHRAPSVPDLIIAATAELAGLTVLHFDKDFDLIAGITGQPAEWLNVH
jgi:predicted nucleic acid-binding protein